jgi:hypothetical protein
MSIIRKLPELARTVRSLESRLTELEKAADEESA